MKFVYLVLAIVIIGGIGVYVMKNTSDTGTPAATEMDEAMNEEMRDETTVEGEVSNTMPAPGMEGMIDEMIVHEDGMSEDMPSMDEEGEMKMFDVHGKNFEFDVQEIRVKEGDTVMIHFASTDGFHDWVIDEFDAATERVTPGTPTTVTFVADTKGTYEYYCSVGNHRAQGMVGKLIVE